MKKSLVIMSSVLAIGVGLAGCSSSDSASKTTTGNATNSSTSTTKPTDTNKQPVQSSTPAPSTDNGVLTKAKFDQIQNGMTYDQVTQIIGSKGELQSATGDKNSPYYTEMYSFKADGNFGANAVMTFQGGKLENKAQMGLGGDSKVTINKTKFDQVQNGMTYEQVQQIIGGAGSVISESGQKGTEFYTIMVEYKGESGLGANANFMFQGNKLENKTQLGLN